LQRGLMAEGAVTVGYTYHGPRITQPIYRDGSIGKAKAHLEKTAHDLNKLLQPIGGTAYTSVNKALVTQASSAIPYMPLYISLLYQVMKEKNCHEGCIEQMDRLFREKLYNGKAVPVDESGRIRVDDWEMRPDIQAEVERRWQLVNTDTLPSLGDREGYRGDFLKLYGFNISGVDYSAEVPESLI